MPFYVKYVKDGATIIVELRDCHNRREAVRKIGLYKKIADENTSIGLTSKQERLSQWRKLVSLEGEITPKRDKER